MRLYKILSRHGQRKRRLWPWFKALPAGAPVRYNGWVWDPKIGEFVRDQVERINVEVKVPKYPKPTQEPRTEQTLYEPGWYWNGRARVWEEIPLTPQEISEGIERGTKPAWPPGTEVPDTVEGWSWEYETKEWVATIVVGQRIGFEPPRSLPPNVDLATVFPADPYFEVSVRTAEVLVAAGRWDILENGDAYFKLVAQVHKLSPTAKYPHLIAEGVFDARYIMHAKRNWLASQEAWQMRVNALGPKAPDYFGATIGIVFLGIVTALTGYLIGSILERITFPPEGDFTLVEPYRMYLLGPDNWSYSRLIGRTVRGRTYYSSCEDIGTEYVRHKRQRGKFGIDVIDFPGGFVETGYKFPYWIKYTWSHWALQYIGMLESVSTRFYRLKKADVDPHATMRGPWMLPEEDWCGDLHHYL